MASFQKRSGAWRAVIRKKGFPTQTATFDTKSEAQAWAADIETAMTRGRFRALDEAERTTLTQAMDRFEREVLSSLRSRTYPSHLKRIKQHLGRQPLAALTPSLIAQYRDACIAEGLSHQTVKHDLNFISRMFNTALMDWFIALPYGNPVAQIRKPALPAGRERRVSEQEETALLEAADRYGGNIAPIIRFALATAMRRGELAAMKWTHVDMQRRVLTIPLSKNGERRYIPLSKAAMAALNSMPRRLDGTVWGMHYDAITKAFVRIRDRSIKANPSLQGLRFHDLRHEATSRLFERGLSIADVGSITGHKDWKMLRRYTHLRPDDLAKKLDALG